MLRKLIVFIIDLGLWGGLAILLYQLLFAQNGLRFYAQINKLLEKQSQQLLEIKNNQGELEYERELLLSDSEFFQREVRQEWSMVKPGDWIMELNDES